MKKKYSIKILLKYSLDSSKIYEESIIIAKMDKIEDIKDKVDLYVSSLNKEVDDGNFIELVSIISYYEIEDKILLDGDFIDVYSRYLNSEEIGSCIL